MTRDLADLFPRFEADLLAHWNHCALYGKTADPDFPFVLARRLTKHVEVPDLSLRVIAATWLRKASRGKWTRAFLHYTKTPAHFYSFKRALLDFCTAYPYEELDIYKDHARYEIIEDVLDKPSLSTPLHALNEDDREAFIQNLFELWWDRALPFVAPRAVALPSHS